MIVAGLRVRGACGVLSAAAVAAACGCATAVAPSRPAAEFPKAEALAAIEAKVAPTFAVAEGPLPEVAWTVELPAGADAPDDTWTPATAWDQAVAAALGRSGKNPRLTRSLTCVARELGRYVLETQKPPPAGLRAFILGACGSFAPEVGITSLHGEVPPAVTDDALLGSWKGQIDGDLVKPLPARISHAGFFLQRRGNTAMGVLAYAVMAAELKPLSPVAGPAGTAGEITIEGHLEGEAQYVAGYVNHGRYGLDHCYVDPTVARPRFSVTCQVRAEDETARIDLVYAQPRRVLAVPFVQLLARRANATSLSYRPFAYAEPREVPNAEAFSRAAIEMLNRVRAETGLAPVRLATAQSAAAARLAGHYFAAASGQGRPEDMDTIALGLLAGWQVTSGQIRDGNFVSTLVPHTRDVGRWLSATLETPLGRSALLSEGIEELALGPMTLAEPEAVGAMAIGYRFHKGADHTADMRRLLLRAVLARRKRKLPDPKRLGIEVRMREELARVHAGQIQPMEALQAVLEDGSTKFGANMRGYVLETTSLDALEIPEEILTQSTLHLEIGVTHHRPPGAAWAQLVILVVFVEYNELRPV
jgi:hypothetical protein